MKFTLINLLKSKKTIINLRSIPEGWQHKKPDEIKFLTLIFYKEDLKLKLKYFNIPIQFGMKKSRIVAKFKYLKLDP